MTGRLVGHDYELLPPEAAIDPSEDKVSIEVTYAIRGTFSQGSPGVRAFFDELIELLTGGAQKH